MIASLFSFNSTPTTEIYTLSLHDALPIYTLQTKLPKEDSEQLLQMTEILQQMLEQVREGFSERELDPASQVLRDRKSTRLNSSHVRISYAVFCLKKKKKTKK